MGTLAFVCVVVLVLVLWVLPQPAQDCDGGSELCEDSLVTLEDSVHYYEDGY